MSRQVDSGIGFIILMASGIVCFVISMMNPGLSKAGLGGLSNLVVPLFSTVVALILYGITLSLKEYRNWIVIILFIANILTGLHLYNLS